MKSLVSLIALGLALGSSSIAAEPSPMAVLDFWAGHCWKGTFPDGSTIDEHCFTWVYAQKAMRDRHVVKAPGRPDYIGETVYFWDSEAKSIAYVYYENLGGVGRGTAQATAEGLAFPDGHYSGGGQVMNYRASWKKQEGAYEAVNEAKKGDGWAPMWDITYRQSGPAS